MRLSVDEVLKQQKKKPEDLITLEECQDIITELNRPNTSAIVSARSNQSITQSQRVVITIDPKVIDFVKYFISILSKKSDKVTICLPTQMRN